MKPVDGLTSKRKLEEDESFSYRGAKVARVTDSGGASVPNGVSEGSRQQQIADPESIYNDVTSWLRQSQSKAEQIAGELKKMEVAISKSRHKVHKGLSVLLEQRLEIARGLFRHRQVVYPTKEMRENARKALFAKARGLAEWEKGLLRVENSAQSWKESVAKHAKLCLQIEKAFKILDAARQAREINGDVLNVHASIDARKASTVELLDTIYRGCFTERPSTSLQVDKVPHSAASGSKLFSDLPSELSRPQVENTPNSMASSFKFFSELPAEIRLEIWQYALPGPRLIAHHSKSNILIPLSQVCRESREVVQKRYSLLVTNPVAENGSSTAYVNYEVDTVVRDLTLFDKPDEGPTLFALEDVVFETQCFRLLYGLSKVRHLALAFNILEENPIPLYKVLQACCPELQSVVFLQGWHMPKTVGEYRCFTPDSNLVDWMHACRDRLSNRILKRRALMEVNTINYLSFLNQQCQDVFRCNCSHHRESFETSLLAKRRAGTWQILPFPNESQEMKFMGYYGKLCTGFVQSQRFCGPDGEILSRYDGMQQLFKEESTEV